MLFTTIQTFRKKLAATIHFQHMKQKQITQTKTEPQYTAHAVRPAYGPRTRIACSSKSVAN